MKVYCDDEKISVGADIFAKRFAICGGKSVFAIQSDKNEVSANSGSVSVYYTDRLSFYRNLFDYFAVGRTLRSPSGFKKIGIMLDCARNGVPGVAFLKEFILAAVAAGYGYLGLYAEDCLEVEGEPYFGYMRGRYSVAEIKEIVSFADLFGFEIVPFVQTLAHMGLLFRHWDPYYRDARDFGDILLMDEPRVYQLIDRLFDTVSANFGKCRVNVGMDEAFMMTYGKYREIHGVCDPAEVFNRHAAKVTELAVKHGLRPEAWADMFTKHKGKVSVPVNLTLRAWDYSFTDEKSYSDMIAECKVLTDKVAFGSGVHKWHGTAPMNEFSRYAYIPAVNAAKNKCDDFLVTLWGDDGAECSHNSVWYSLLTIANEANTDKFSVSEQNKIAKAMFGADMPELLSLDLPNKVFEEEFDKPVNVSKYLFYEDVFYGNADFTASDGFVPYFEKAEEVLSEIAEKSDVLREIYEEEAYLCAVLKKKCGMRNKLRSAYKKGDKTELLKLAESLFEIKEAVSEFAFRTENRWLKENKAFGIEVMQIRLGGLINRLDFCARRVKNYVGGKVGRIEELEAADLSPQPSGDNYADARAFNSYEQNVTYCNVTHKLYN